jgi:hypothetical protein
MGKRRPRAGLRGSLDERAQRLASAAHHRIAVREQEDVEVEVEQPGVCVAEPLLRPLRLVHKPVGDKPESVRGSRLDDAVSARQRAVLRDVESGLVGTDRVDLVYDGAARKLVAEIERLDWPASIELVDAVTDAVHRAPELIAQAPGVAIVVAVREQDVLRGAVLAKPIETLFGNHRIDQHPFGLEIMRTDLRTDVVVARGPVPQALRNLAHGPRLPLARRLQRPRNGPAYLIRQL